MEVLLTLAGITTLYSLLIKKERFEETYYDDESYVKLNPKNNENINTFNPSQGATTNFNTPSFPEYRGEQSQLDFIKNNSIYSENKINGIPLKDYYSKYTERVLSKGEWFLNKDMPQDTKQYSSASDSQVQQRMEIFTGLQQQRDRETLGVPTKTETMNLFTPQERTTGYGYQYSIGGGGGPGLSITRAKEMEELKQTIRYKRNEQPFEKIHIGKGLAMDPQVPAAGGFQEYARILPSNVGDHKANQLPGRVTFGKWVYSNAPTSQQPVIKNRPNGYYTLCQRGPAAGKSTITAETIRPDFGSILKNQNRSTVNYGFGVPITNLESFLVVK